MDREARQMNRPFPPYELVDLTRDEAAEIDERLENFDWNHVGYELGRQIELGVKIGGKLVAGLLGYTTLFHILYVETVWVDEAYRRKGLGAALLAEMEKRAGDMGVNLIRLDTFDWQGYEFYKACGYEEVGRYTEPRDRFSEYFFVKRLQK